MFAAGLAFDNLLALLAAVPGLVLVLELLPSRWTLTSGTVTLLELAPVLALSFLVAYALLIVVMVRLVAPLIRPGWQAGRRRRCSRQAASPCAEPARAPAARRT